MSKKTILILILALLGIAIGFSTFTWSNRQKPVSTISEQKPPRAVTISVDFGNGKILSGNVKANTPYEALTALTSTQKIAVGVKQYDFGVFIESLAGVKGDDKKAWIYFINGASGQIAADKYELKDGDKVEWRYTDVKNE